MVGESNNGCGGVTKIYSIHVGSCQITKYVDKVTK